MNLKSVDLDRNAKRKHIWNQNFKIHFLTSVQSRLWERSKSTNAFQVWPIDRSVSQLALFCVKQVSSRGSRDFRLFDIFTKYQIFHEKEEYAGAKGRFLDSASAWGAGIFFICPSIHFICGQVAWLQQSKFSTWPSMGEGPWRDSGVFGSLNREAWGVVQLNIHTGKQNCVTTHLTPSDNTRVFSFLRRWQVVISSTCSAQVSLVKIASSC